MFAIIFKRQEAALSFFSANEMDSKAKKSEVGSFRLMLLTEGSFHGGSCCACTVDIDVASSKYANNFLLFIIGCILKFVLKVIFYSILDARTRLNVSNDICR